MSRRILDIQPCTTKSLATRLLWPQRALFHCSVQLQIKLSTSGEQKPACLAEVTRVVLVEHDAVVVLATRVTAASRVLPVLANAAMPSADVPALLAVLAQACKSREADSQNPCNSCDQVHMQEYERRPPVRPLTCDHMQSSMPSAAAQFQRLGDWTTANVRRPSMHRELRSIPARPWCSAKNMSSCKTVWPCDSGPRRLLIRSNIGRL